MFDHLKRTTLIAAGMLAVSVALGLSGASCGSTGATVRPDCPTEDACTIDYRAGEPAFVFRGTVG